MSWTHLSRWVLGEIADAMTSADATSGADADEAAAAAIDPAAPLRGPAFEGADDATLGDDEWLARAIAAAAEAGLVGDAGAVAERLGEVGLEARAARENENEGVGGEAPASPSLDARIDSRRETAKSRPVGEMTTRSPAVAPAVPRAPRGWSVGQTNACLLVDNYDSYTYNLFHLVAAVDGTPPVVIANDRVGWAELRERFADRRFSRCVLSPGPGNPRNPRDVGVCRDIVERATETPVLGVCLGHQLLAHAHGARVTRARVPTHGRVSVVRHDGRGALFDAVPREFRQTRYHSLVVDPASLDAAGALRATAWTAPADADDDDDGLFVNEWVTADDIASERAGGAIMALEHVSRPHFGVQFHPESVCSEPHGARVYANFAAAAARHWKRHAAGSGTEPERPTRLLGETEAPPLDRFATVSSARPTAGPDRPTKLLWTRLPRALAETPGGAETLFWSVVAPRATRDAPRKPACVAPHGTDDRNDAPRAFSSATAREKRGGAFLPTEATRDTFWLDSATADVSPGGCARSRFSFMGGVGGSLWRRATYRLPRSARDRGDPGDPGDPTAAPPRVGAPPPFRGGRLEVTDAKGARTVREGVAVTAYLEEALERRRCGAHERVASWAERARRRAFSRARVDDPTVDAKDGERPERKTEDDDVPARETDPPFADPPFDFRGGFVGYLGYETRAECGAQFLPSNAASTPDAAFFFADRFVVADHATGDVFVAALADDARAALEPYAREATENENRNGLASAAAAAAEGVLRVAIEDAEADARAWMAETERAVLGCAAGTGGRLARTETTGVERDDAARAPPRPPLAADALARARAAASEPEPAAGDAAAARFAPRAARDAYVRAIRASQGAIDAGETYEVCLTNQLVRGGDAGAGAASLAPDPATLYSVLRATNPAPYAAYLCFGGCAVTDRAEDDDDAGARRPPKTSLPGARVFDDDDDDDDDAKGSGSAADRRDARACARRAYPADDVLAVCCCSPERFLRLSRAKTNDASSEALDASEGALVLEAKPIKGTAARVAPPGCAADVAEAVALERRVKDRAENLMIVDLLRNDLGRVCAPGSVAVPGLMKVESYATVHQLVSTVRGAPRLDGGGDAEGTGSDRVTAIACVTAAFPPGSMTGAPKARTCEIIDGLEDAPRGVYSGAVGFFSAAGDAFDLNVCIRTCVVRPATDQAWIGCGGAITALSDANEEWEETRLKARAVLRAVRAVDEAADAERARREATRAETRSVETRT